MALMASNFWMAIWILLGTMATNKNSSMSCKENEPINNHTILNGEVLMRRMISTWLLPKVKVLYNIKFNMFMQLTTTGAST